MKQSGETQTFSQAIELHKIYISEFWNGLWKKSMVHHSGFPSAGFTDQSKRKVRKTSKDDLMFNFTTIMTHPFTNSSLQFKIFVAILFQIICMATCLESSETTLTNTGTQAASTLTV